MVYRAGFEYILSCYCGLIFKGYINLAFWRAILIHFIYLFSKLGLPLIELINKNGIRNKDRIYRKYQALWSTCNLNSLEAT